MVGGNDVGFDAESTGRESRAAPWIVGLVVVLGVVAIGTTVFIARYLGDNGKAATPRTQTEADVAANDVYRSTCKQYNGTITETQPDQSDNGGLNADPAGEYCSVTYRGDTWQVPLNEDGTYDAVTAAENKTDCDNDAQDAQNAATDGIPWSQLPVWHARTGLCERGSP